MAREIIMRRLPGAVARVVLAAAAATVFKLASDGTESVLYSFKGTTDGASPIRR